MMGREPNSSVLKNKRWLWIKRSADVVFASAFLLLTSPLFLVISLMILREDGRPVFFRQPRLGKGGKVFQILKFRSMIRNAQKQGAGIFIEKEDSRITKTGRWLRKTSLDELPQLLNILKGEMSFIGPRPPLPDYPKTYEDYEPWVKERFDMLPGMTGLAQIHGRNEIEWYERFKWDTEYVRGWSIRMDLSILLRSAKIVLSAKGIYGKNRYHDDSKS